MTKIKEDNSYRDNIALGRFPDRSNVYKFGASSAINSSESIIWDGGNGYNGFLSAADFVTVQSDDVNDALAGIGMQKVRIYGINELNEYVDEEIELNGTTPVLSTRQYIRIFRAHSTLSNTTIIGGRNNLGEIQVKSQTGGNVMAQINVGEGQTQMALFTVAVGYHALILNADANVGEGKEATIRVVSVDYVNQGGARVQAIRKLFQNSFTRNYKIPRAISGGTDIFMTGESTAAGTTATASFEILLIKD